MAVGARDSRLNFRLPAELKNTIEEAAEALGQSVSEFAVGTLVQHAREVLRQRDVTLLNARDRGVFIGLLEDRDAKPNRALLKATKRYKTHFG
jgi:uncharacterized protein (DUF1778 family)